MITKIPQGDPGVASFTSQGHSQVDVFMSDSPAQMTAPMKIAATTAAAGLPIFSVVGVNSTGEIVPAEHGTTQAIGFTSAAITANTAKAPIHRAAHVNINGLDWPASYDTVEKKLGAFDGAPTPTSILADQNPNDPTFS